jgi:type IV pilus assembly protein PilE
MIEQELMRMRCTLNRSGRQAGFTLVELMVTCVVVAILAAIAIPSYNSAVRKSRRTEARNALLDLAGREERYLATNNQYSNDPAALGYSGFPAATSGGYYNLQAPTITAGGLGSAPSFSVSATAAGPQVSDTDCQTFKVDSTGAQTAQNSSSADSTATCWK